MHRTPNALALIALFLGAVLPAGGQELQPRDVPSRDVAAFSFTSPTMRQRYDVTVGFPSGYDTASTRKYPTLVVTDGNQMFPLAHSAAHSLEGAITELFIISIAVPFEEGDSAHTRRRIYEFSPPNWAMTDPFGVMLTGLCGAYGTAPDRCVGGAPSFLRLIVGEVLPRVATKYPIDMSNLGLFGLSAGGFFASWAIFQPESPFRTYIISSPAMSYGDNDVLRQEARFAEGRKDMAVSIYMASGSLEMDDPMLEGIGHIVSGQIRLAAALRGRNYPSLRLFSEIHPGLGHSDAAGTTLVRGMRLLYAKQ